MRSPPARQGVIDMSVVSVRTELKEGTKHNRHTGLIWLTRIGTGAFQESHRQVLVADLSTETLGEADAGLGNTPDLPVAINDRQDNTGI